MVVKLRDVSLLCVETLHDKSGGGRPDFVALQELVS